MYLLQQPDTDQWAIEGFYIYYGPFDDKQIDYQREMVLGSSVRHAVLTHLDTDVAYSIRMQSYTAAGTLSQFSNTVVKQTLGTLLLLLATPYPVLIELMLGLQQIGSISCA